MSWPLAFRSTLDRVREDNARLVRVLNDTQIRLRVSETQRDVATRQAAGMLEQERDRWAGLLAVERARADKLVETLLNMRRTGYELPLQAGAAHEPEDVMPPEVDKAIRALTMPGTPVYRQLREFAAGQLAAKVEPGAVATMIRRGADLDELEAESLTHGDTPADELL